MNTSQIILFAGLAVVIIATQLGRRPVNALRFLLPVAGVAWAAFTYLQGVPTAGGDLPFEALCTLAGLALGLLAAACVRVERDGSSGQIMLQAGLAYAVVWVLAFGGRLAFGWAASHGWQHAVGQFSFQHALTGEAAWTAAFVLSALAMVAARTVALGARVLLA